MLEDRELDACLLGRAGKAGAEACRGGAVAGGVGADRCKLDAGGARAELRLDPGPDRRVEALMDLAAGGVAEVGERSSAVERHGT